MKMLAFARRSGKEMLRDKLNLIFGVGFPVIVMLLLTVINSNVPVKLDTFALNNLTPGIAVFGMSFISLFSGMVIAKDRSGAFMLRLFTSPMRASDFILGYTLPLLPIAVVQALISYILAVILGLEATAYILLSLVVLIPAMVLFIAIGLFCGTVLNDRQVGGLCGALLTNLTAWLSGIWFDLDLLGGGFKTFANLLPFAHAVNAGRAALNGRLSDILPELIWVAAYAAVIMVAATLIFTRKMKSGDK